MFFTSFDVFVFRKIPSNYFVAVFLREIRFQEIKEIKTLLFADDEVIVSDSEDALQIYIHKLETVAARCGLKIPTRKTKTVAFKGSDSVGNKIVINNNNNNNNNNNTIGSGRGGIDWEIRLRIGTVGGQL
jgi:hypothetical protein